MLFVLMRCAAAEILSLFDVVAQQWRPCACALRAALAVKGRELRGRLCGACCCCGSGGDKAVVAEVRRQQ